jgi:hypothetical protein
MINFRRHGRSFSDCVAWEGFLGAWEFTEWVDTQNRLGIIYHKKIVIVNVYPSRCHVLSATPVIHINARAYRTPGIGPFFSFAPSSSSFHALPAPTLRPPSCLLILHQRLMSLSHTNCHMTFTQLLCVGSSA